MCVTFLISRSGIMLTREREKIIYTLCSFPITIQKSLIIRFVGPTKDVGKKSRSRVETTSNHTAGNRWMRTRYGRECWKKDFGSTWIKVWTTELWLTYSNITTPSCPFTESKVSFSAEGLWFSAECLTCWPIGKAPFFFFLFLDAKSE